MFLSQVFETMASGAQSNKISQSIGAEPAAGLQMVDVEVTQVYLAGSSELKEQVPGRASLLVRGIGFIGVSFGSHWPSLWPSKAGDAYPLR